MWLKRIWYRFFVLPRMSVYASDARNMLHNSIGLEPESRKDLIALNSKYWALHDFVFEGNPFPTNKTSQKR